MRAKTVMPVMVQTKIRDVNWCSLYGEPEDCFPHDEHCFQFDSSKVNLPMLLVMSGVYPTYLAALAGGFKGKVEFGWSYVERNGVSCYFWNPDPDWEPSDEDDEAIIGERDFQEDGLPWLGEETEMWGAFV